MNEELQNKLLELANQLQVTVPELYQVYVKQALVVVYTDLMALIVTVVALAFFVLLPIVHHKHTRDAGEDFKYYMQYNEGMMVISGVGSVIFGIASIICLLSFSDSLIVALNNPEYYALSRILH